MDEPIYRIKDGERIKMLSLREGHEKIEKLREHINEMKESGEWDEYLKQQALNRRKEQMFEGEM